MPPWRWCFDTLLAKLTPAEVDAVLAHELGHFKHKHIIQRIVAMFAMAWRVYCHLGWLSTQTWFWSGVMPNLATFNDALALLLFLLLMPVFSFLSRRCWPRVYANWFGEPTYAVQQTSGQDLASALLNFTS